MAINFAKLSYFKNLASTDIPATIELWINELKAPTIIDFTHENSDKWRVVTTLLYGNEPSGLIALHQWIKQATEKKLASNIRFIICSIEAAQHKPLFTKPFLPNGKNLDRCFSQKSLSDYYLRAELISSCVRQVKPEAVIDIHSAKGQYPLLASSTHECKAELYMTSLFCKHLIILNEKKGRFVEQNFNCPLLSFNVGINQEQHGVPVAFNLIKQFCSIENVLSLKAHQKVKVLSENKDVLNMTT